MSLQLETLFGSQNTTENSIENDEVFPTSFAQQRLWFLHQLDPESPAYNMAVQLRLIGELQAVILQKALNEIVQRHEPLRTNYKMIDGHPMQVIAPFAVLEMPIFDLSCLPPHERDEKQLELTKADAIKPFNLACDPVIRAQLIRLNSTEHILALNLHHIAGDGWSLPILFREIGALYEDFSCGRDSSLPPLPIQYADFAVWQRQLLQGEVFTEQLNYWKNQLADAPALVEFPLDHPRPAVQSFQGSRISFFYNKELSDGLKNISRKERCSLFMTLLAAFKVLLMRCSCQSDIVIGTPIGIRNRAEIENLVGCFLNTLVMRTDLSGDPTFREMLARVRTGSLEAYDHQDLPFDRIVEELKIPRQPGRNPLFQILFQYLAVPLTVTKFCGLTMEKLPAVENHTAKFDLTFTLEERLDGIGGELEYRCDLFERATVERLLTHFQILLEAVVQNPDQKIATLPLLSDLEKHQLLLEWNDTAVPYPTEITLVDLFEKQVEATPESVAVIFENRQLTYRELNERANQLARRLEKNGVGADTVVSVSLERSLEMVVAIFGILKAGAAYVPLDSEYPKDRLLFMLQDSQTPVLLTQKNLREKFSSEQSRIICLDSDWETIAQESRENLASKPNAEELAYVIYTSGSTGQPKGVMISHAAICNHMLWMQETFPLEKTDRVLQKTLFSFDASVWEFFAPIFAGAQLVIAKPEGHRDSAYLVKTIAEYKITILQVVPSVLRVLLDEPGFKNCTSLKRVFCGGEALAPELVKLFTSVSNAQLCNLYGPTETTIDAAYWICSEKESVSIGKPVANTQIYLLDQHLQPVPIGVAGEVCIAGRGLARGYWNRAELTAEKFIPSPFSQKPGARLYKTGDLARHLPDGNIEYLGRIDHQVKVRGFRIELGEIETVARSFPGVRESVVTAREDSSGETRLVAYLVGFGNQEFDGELRAYLKTKLPDYMVPSAFVMLNALPLSPNGKINRNALPAPDFSAVASRFIAPRTDIEKQMTQIWCDVLKLKQVGIHDDFFELGGHSLLATQVISRVRSSSGKDLALRDFFSAPTVAGLSALLENCHEAQTDVPKITRLSRKTNAVALSA